MHSWIKEFPAAITVCDRKGIITGMNDKSVKIFEKDGGKKLVGKNLLDCHPEPSKSQLKEMMKMKKSNCYTIEKNGKKKMIYQSPWYEKGNYKGFVEISLEIPFDLPNIIRD